MGDVYNAMMLSGQAALLEDQPGDDQQATDQPGQPVMENVLRLRVKPDPNITEQFEEVRVKLLQQAAQRRLQIHAFTSTFSGEGRSTCALHLALSFAQLPNTRVLLIDMDSCSQHKLADHFEGPIAAGFSDFISDPSTALNTVTYPTDVLNLHVMPFGTATSMSNDALLGHRRLNQLLERVPDLYDHVVIDAPPVLGQGGGLQVSQLSDETIMAVALKKTPVDRLRQAQKMLTDHECQITGVLLTQQGK